MQHAITVYLYNEERARKRERLEVCAELKVEGPEIVNRKGDIDTVRLRVAQAVRERFPGRKIRGVSALVKGGFSVVVELAK